MAGVSVARGRALGWCDGLDVGSCHRRFASLHLRIEIRKRAHTNAQGTKARRGAQLEEDAAISCRAADKIRGASQMSVGARLRHAWLDREIGSFVRQSKPRKLRSRAGDTLNFESLRAASTYRSSEMTLGACKCRHPAIFDSYSHCGPTRLLGH